ncbi:MAG: iron-sulfur cluster assembly protein [Bacteroidota bacterium]
MAVDKKKLKSSIIKAIKTCYDPEIPVNVYALGLIYDIRIDDKADVEIDMTLTSPACPVAESLVLDVENKVKAVDKVKSVKVNIVFDPPWYMGMMSKEAKLELGIM